jgi:hypothetical protein
MNLEFWFGIFHLFFSIFIAAYGVITTSKKYDYIWISTMLIIYIIWTFLNGECFVNKIFNFILNRRDYHNLEVLDIKLVFTTLFPGNIIDYVYTFYRVILAVLLFTTIFLVSNRNKFNIFIPIIAVLYIIVYTYLLGRGKHVLLFYLVQESIKIICIVALLSGKGKN